MACSSSGVFGASVALAYISSRYFMRWFSSQVQSAAPLAYLRLKDVHRYQEVERDGSSISLSQPLSFWIGYCYRHWSSCRSFREQPILRHEEAFRPLHAWNKRGT